MNNNNNNCFDQNCICSCNPKRMVMYELLLILVLILPNEPLFCLTNRISGCQPGKREDCLSYQN